MHVPKKKEDSFRLVEKKDPQLNHEDFDNKFLY